MEKLFFSLKKMLVFSTLIVLFVLVGCEGTTDNNVVLPQKSNYLLNDVANELNEAYNVINLNDLYVEGDADFEFKTLSEALHYSCNCGPCKCDSSKHDSCRCDSSKHDSCKQKFEKGKKGEELGQYKNNGPRFSKIFTELNLTDAQKESITSFMQAHKQCRREAMTALKEAQSVIIQNANVARKAILEDLKNKIITKTEARRLLTELAKQVREDMKNSPDVQAALEALRSCHTLFINNISSVLTEEQLVIWNKFLETIKI